MCYNGIARWVQRLAARPKLWEAVTGWADRLSSDGIMRDIIDGPGFVIPPEAANSVIPIALFFDAFQPFKANCKYSVLGE